MAIQGWEGWRVDFLMNDTYLLLVCWGLVLLIWRDVGFILLGIPWILWKKRTTVRLNDPGCVALD